MHSDWNDEGALVAALKSHQSDAFEFAIRRFGKNMLATARAITGPTPAEDVVQDAWLTVFERIGSFEQRSSLKTWLQRIVANRAISYLRSRSREVALSPNDEMPNQSDWFDSHGSWRVGPPQWGADRPESLLEADELQACLEKHLQFLPENQRIVLVLKDMQGMSFQEIEGELGVTSSNVRVLLHRARLRLMKMVDHFQETGRC